MQWLRGPQMTNKELPPDCVVKFGAAWCQPCKVVAPHLQAAVRNTGATLVEIDIDEERELTTSLGIRSVPTVVLFRDGRPVHQLVGTKTQQEYEEMIGEHSR